MTITKALAVLWVGLAALPAFAHHSSAMYDQSKTLTADAVVSIWQFTNPHGKLWVYINDSANKPTLYALEAPGPKQLAIHGWDKSTVRPGDKVKVSWNPERTGIHGGLLTRIVLRDGRSFETGGPPPNAGFPAGTGAGAPPPQPAASGSTP